MPLTKARAFYWIPSGAFGRQQSGDVFSFGMLGVEVLLAADGDALSDIWHDVFYGSSTLLGTRLAPALPAWDWLVALLKRCLDKLKEPRGTLRDVVRDWKYVDERFGPAPEGHAAEGTDAGAHGATGGNGSADPWSDDLLLSRSGPPSLLSAGSASH